MGGILMSWAKFKRIDDSNNIDDIDFEDGAFIVTKDGKSYTDFDDERVPIAGTPDNEMSDTSRNTVENKVIKEYVDTELNSYEPKGKIIWTNPNPTNNFDAQTITLDESLDNYDEYEILVLQSTTNSRLISTGRIPVGHGTIISYNTSSYLYRPTGTIVSGDTISFEDGKGVVGTTVTVQNESIVPMYVIGYNTGLFE
jgi:hypothetical protein